MRVLTLEYIQSEMDIKVNHFRKACASFLCMKICITEKITLKFTGKKEANK